MAGQVWNPETAGGLKMYYAKLETWLCEMVFVGDEHGISLLHLCTEKNKRNFAVSEDWIENSGFFKDEILQIKEYLAGERQNFDIKLNPEGTEFQKKVWRRLCQIPYGKTAKYKEIALSIGNGDASRAVGMANGKNPIPLIIPCHRVVGSDGKLTGYAFGLGIKQKLISLEKENCNESSR